MFLFPKRFVAKIPLVGLISKCLDCVFLQQESKSSDFKGVTGVVTNRVHEAHQSEFAAMMMLFPGTTTNGDYLHPFEIGTKDLVLHGIQYQGLQISWVILTG